MPNALPYCLRIIALRPANRSSHRLNGQEVPNVDVLVTTCNEDVDVVLDTVRAACDLDYPADRFRVIVCDDGGSSALRSTITTLVENHTNLFYTSRVKGAVKDYKAGNLNYGLQHSASLLGLPAVEREISEASLSSNSLGTHRPATISSATTPFGSNCVSELSLIRQTPPWGEYVAGLDADMIPEPHWLRTILPHLIRDPSMALACPPQVRLATYMRRHGGRLADCSSA